MMLVPGEACASICPLCDRRHRRRLRHSAVTVVALVKARETVLLKPRKKVFSDLKYMQRSWSTDTPKTCLNHRLVIPLTLACRCVASNIGACVVVCARQGR